MSEISQNEIWMLKAIKQAEKAYSIDEVPVGCIIVRDNIIIGNGYNQSELLKDSTAHAEMIAITSAANNLGNWRLNDCSLYVTKEPCVMCFGAIVNSRIKNLYYGFEDFKNGFHVKVIDEYFFNTHLEKINHGILKDKCKSLIENFFKNKRKNNKKTYK
tara:strand:+ start:430 stop:906 length:477 start_codon:yes stop_codon:yes gene_type:complete